MKILCKFQQITLLWLMIGSTVLAQISPDLAVPVILDTNKMEWESFPGIAGKQHRYEKLLAADPASASPARWAIRLVYAPPGWFEPPEPPKRSYAEYFEWAFFLAGELPFCSYDNPADETCNLTTYRPGIFMDRPRFSVHGLPDPRIEPGLPVSKTGSISLFWHEKDAPEPFFGRPAPEAILQMDKRLFTKPREFDTRAMDWQPHPLMKGWLIKPLADYPGLTQVALIHRPAGRLSESAKPVKIVQHEFRYVLSGEMPFWHYAPPVQHTPKLTILKNDYFIHLPPGSVLGTGTPNISPTGCTFLQIVRFDLK